LMASKRMSFFWPIKGKNSKKKAPAISQGGASL